MVKFTEKNRKAISPIIATVLIIAVTLIAAVAIGGFVFGLFGSSTNTAQIQAISASIKATTVASGASASVVFTCTTSSTNGNLVFSNSGTVGATVLSLSITYGGSTFSGTAPAGCVVNAGSSTAISFTTLQGTVPVPSAGTQYSGFIALSNGAQVVFTGAFQ